MSTTLDAARLLVSAPSHYATRLARNAEEIRAAQVLRFEVFNLELHEGLASSHVTGLDADPFDEVCDHLLVEHKPSGNIVGTYRLQTGLNAKAHLGYYCAQEFHFDVFEPLRPGNHPGGPAHAPYHSPATGNLVVLGLLWKGIADYAKARGGRYLMGCSSLTSQDAAVGSSRPTPSLCHKHLVAPQWRTTPLPAYECSLNHVAAEPVKIPKLLRAYLTLASAKIMWSARARPAIQDDRFF